jgi:adenosylcobinamide-GDP ribazoletransferase
MTGLENLVLTMNALLTAFQFLTRLPLPAPAPTPAVVGRSVWFYPAVGLAIGGLLWLLNGLLGGVDGLLRAALVLFAWVVLSGGLHLDGLADTADAWVGGQGDRERTLAILKDPAAGPMGVTALVLVLLTKYAALVTLVDTAPLPALLLAPFVGRLLLPLLFLTTPYVRVGGLGAMLAENLPRPGTWVVLAAWAFGALVVFGGRAVAAALLPLVAFALWRLALQRRLGGTTGDTAGALVEVAELLTLIGLAIG